MLPTLLCLFLSRPNNPPNLICPRRRNQYLELEQGIPARLKVPLPRREVQDRIASILSTYDDLIENNARRIAILEEMARRIFEEWFVHFRAPGCECLPMVEGAVGRVPRGWEVVPVGGVLGNQTGGTWGSDEPTHETPNRVRVIRGTDFPRLGAGQFELVPRRFVSNQHLQSRVLVDGDIIIEVSGGSKDQPVGRAILVDEVILAAFDEPVLFASFCRLMRPHKIRASPLFLIEYLRRQYRTREIMTFQKQSTGISNLRFSDFANRSLIALPSISLKTRYSEIVSPKFRQASILRRQNANLRAQRDLLLPKLISGEIEVTGSVAALSEAAE
jgi:type I restriction enzyme, S subunit